MMQSKKSDCQCRCICIDHIEVAQFVWAHSSVCLSGISVFHTMPISSATFVRRNPRQVFSCPTMNAAAFGCAKQ